MFPNLRPTESTESIESAVTIEAPVAEVAVDAPEAPAPAALGTSEAPARRRRSLPTLRKPAIARRPHGRPGRSGNAVTGLHLEAGEAIAVVARADAGRLVLQRAAAIDLHPGSVRDGEVHDTEGLAMMLKRLFSEHGLPKRVRVGIANQRTIMRTIDLPPLQRDAEIAAAVRMHAPDHIAMPMDQVVMDHQVLGRVDTPEGPRTRVVVVATDRESVDRLLTALRRAGLRPEGLDLSAFALIRALHAGARGIDGPVLYAHVGGTTTMAIGEGTDCRFTRVSNSGFDAFATQLAERAEVGLDEARQRLMAAGAEGLDEDAAASAIVEQGAGTLGDDLRTSIEFYASQWSGAVSEVVLTGTAVAVPGFAAAVEKRVGLPVRAGELEASAEALGGLEPWRVAVAAGPSVEEVTA
jgi:type IV pilus assembly protein PilM